MPFFSEGSILDLPNGKLLVPVAAEPSLNAKRQLTLVFQAFFHVLALDWSHSRLFQVEP